MPDILQEMLNSVPDTYDKREGSFIYDALAPAAEQIENIETKIEEVKDKFIIDNLSGDELTKRVNSITGIERRAATKATGTVTLTGTGTINEGDLFETESGVQFRAVETVNISESGTVNVEAVIAGTIGNVASNTITLFPVTLPGFTAVTNESPTTGGFEEESDADLKTRYYERLRTPATSGNKAHYVNWAKEISGVGDARVIPLWNGDNTVKVVIIDSNRQPADQSLIDAVQEYIDPNSSGLGEGQAPLGAFCTVVSATGVTINVNAKVTLGNISLAQVQSDIEQALTQYLYDIAFKESFVSYARVGNAILNVPEVLDYTNLLINGGTANINIGTEEVAILGTVNISE